MDFQAVQHLLHWMDKFSTASPRKGDVPLVCSIRHERILSTTGINTSDGAPAETIRHMRVSYHFHSQGFMFPEPIVNLRSGTKDSARFVFALLSAATRRWFH
ncbi:hypothetical protein M431DRAFT_497207 [Trichoderma harzianum CBS 226.95]|uniref:Uncharacterized protein n=1 Tax=Trichoderma harzianum CBS 226.95 TaxID=983964 RepID=A0A2T4A738_TRIHA|nr:hypothetical protein M431DRAFT_497207 [Trichoderma harzianum CBS 226.95]PTB52892.1 hypothetical protein M431DRAFT_497207 [Trichoderma harzianum CBS 226.95]